MFFYGWNGDNGDADNFLSLFDSKEIKSTLNAAKYSNPKVDELLAKGRITQMVRKEIKFMDKFKI